MILIHGQVNYWWFNMKNLIELRYLTMTIDGAVFAADSPVEALPTDGFQHRGVRPVEQVFLHYR